MIKLIWLIATITAQGPASAELPDEVQFKTSEECKVYADEHRARMADWVRGAVRGGWEHPVRIEFRCDEGPRA